ncbi:MAG: ribonuclease III [Weeksellaceae bacterium]|nr:ribonuclease III [Weeksellaceae bacterium]
MLFKKIRALFEPKKKAKSDYLSNPTYLSDELIQILQFIPENPDLFVTAFTPRSAQITDANNNHVNYERLEFLGDAVLGTVIAEYLYQNSPSEREGYLTQMRSKVVSRQHLNEIGKELNLTGFIDAKIKKRVMLSNHVEGDLFEALIGAVYMDQGFEKTREFIHTQVIEPYVNLDELENKITSYKSKVLEWSQKNKFALDYNTLEERTEDDMTIFVSMLRVDGELAGKGRGTSKKKAEEAAAKSVFISRKLQ